MTKEQFISFYKGQPNEKSAGDCYDVISQALKNEGILTNLTLIGALATVRTEVGRNFLPIAENRLFASLKKYGVTYRGRGYIQLTWAYNYKIYGDFLGIDLLNNPDLALRPDIAAKILARYFKNNRCNVECDKQNWLKVRQLVNGGTNGLATFLDIIKQYNQFKNMETLEILSIAYDDSLNKTSIDYDTYDDGDLNNRSSHCWIEDGKLDGDSVLALAKSRVDAGINVILNLTGTSQQPKGDGSVKI